MEETLPIPKIDNWQRLYEPDAKARCIKDNPPMKGFGQPIKVGDVVEAQTVCWQDGKYSIAVDKECAFYDLEGYFEVLP